MANKGWVAIHRKLLDSSIWIGPDSFDTRSAWIDLLLKVNHEEKTIVVNAKPRTIKRGQMLTSVRKLSMMWHWSNTKTIRFLETLQRLGMIYKESAMGGTLVTIVNYSDYQDLRNTSGNASDNASGNRSGNANGNQTTINTFGIKNNELNNVNNGSAAPAFSGWEE